MMPIMTSCSCCRGGSNASVERNDCFNAFAKIALG